MTPKPVRFILERENREEILEFATFPIAIGRDRGVELFIDERRISRRHAEIDRNPNGNLTLADLDSGNGTTLDGRPVGNSPEPLSAGSEIALGGAVRLWVERRPAVARSFAGASLTGPSPREGSPRRARSKSAKSGALAGVIAVLALGGGVWFFQRSGDARPVPETSHVANLETPAPHLAGSSGEGDTPTPAGVGAPDPETHEAPPSISADAGILQDFELALVDEQFRAAKALAERIGHPDQALEARQKLVAAMDATAQTWLAESARIAQSRGAKEASEFLTARLQLVPLASLAHTQLSGALLDLAPAGAPSGSDIASAPGAEEGSNRGTSGSPTPRTPRPSATPRTPDPHRVLPGHEGDHPSPAMAQHLEDANRALKTRDWDEAEKHFSAVVSQTAESSSRRLDAERGLRAVAAQRRMMSTLVSTLGEDPPSLGRAPIAPGVVGTIIRVEPTGLTFTTGGESTQRLGWGNLSQRAFDWLLKKTTLSDEANLDAAAWLFGYGSAGKEPAETLLAQLFRRNAELKPRIDQLLADSREIAVPSEGFQLEDGSWRSPTDLSRRRFAEIVAQATQAIEGEDANARADAVAMLSGLGDLARSPLHRALVSRRATVRQRVKKNKAYAALAGVAARYQELEDARAHALSLIFDTTRFPYPYRQPEATPEAALAYRETRPKVDAAIAATTAIWTDSRAHAAIPAEMRVLVGELVALDDAIRSVGYGDAPVDGDLYLQFLPAADRLTLKNIAYSLEDRQRLDRSERILAQNQTDPQGATPPEAQQCAITNEYRLMMGRDALRLHAPLVKASHDHCEDMSKHGFFAHDSPVPGKKSVHDRLLLEGIEPVGGSENIAMNTSPLGAHRAWLGSPGHHRNILGRNWRLMGPGNSGRNWCQNYIAADRKVPEAGQ